MELLLTIVAIIIGYIGNKIKKIYTEKSRNETVEKIITMVCTAIEQLYGDLSGSEKLEKAKEYIREMLASKKIEVNDLEMQILIESTVKGLKQKKE